MLRTAPANLIRLLLTSLLIISLGCGPRQTIRCTRVSFTDQAPSSLRPTARVIVPPLAYADQVPQGFARLAGETLGNALSDRFANVVSPEQLRAIWERRLNRPWVDLGTQADCRTLQRVFGEGVAVLGSVKRYVYGAIGPSQIELSIVVAELASCKTIAEFEVWASSRKGMAYSGLSASARAPEELLEASIQKATRAIAASIDRWAKRLP